VAWFLVQSIFIILAAFLLGLLVGWLIWGRQWSNTRADEPAAPAANNDPLAARPAEPAEATAGPAAPANLDEPSVQTKPETEPEPEPETEPEPEPETEPEPEPQAEPEPQPEPEPQAEPELVPVTVPIQATAPDEATDDLKRIEGIGPQMERALNQAGIRTYQQLAESNVETLRTAIKTAGLRLAPSLPTWARQARLLADGDEQGFADLTRSLVAGRDRGRA
jgi:predicted flap endonuclease-1-like 5' DNA nuclease